MGMKSSRQPWNVNWASRFTLIASKSIGIPELRARILALARNPPSRPVPLTFCRCRPSSPLSPSALATLLMQTFSGKSIPGPGRGTLLLSDETISGFQRSALSGENLPERQQGPATTRDAGIDWRSAVIESRYARITEIEQSVLTRTTTTPHPSANRLDAVLTHRVWGLIIFVAIMAMLFQSIFTFATYPMDLLTMVVDAFGATVSEWLPRAS
jgi:ferrous iron transport protein B